MKGRFDQEISMCIFDIASFYCLPHKLILSAPEVLRIDSIYDVYIFR